MNDFCQDLRCFRQVFELLVDVCLFILEVSQKRIEPFCTMHGHA